MLSYRHGYHAGNHADVLKHIVLVETLQYMLKKDSPVLYIDTHAGPGGYYLEDAMSKKTDEALGGVLKLDFDKLPDSIKLYHEAVKGHLGRKFYPGSPQLAADILRPTDKLRFFELHSTEIRTLEARFERDRRVQISATDGFDSLKSLLPVQNSRAIVLMDPPYEIKTDFKASVESITEGYRRMPHATFLIWYPVVDRGWIELVKEALLKKGIKDCWQYELAVAPDDEELGMTASGIIAINPPWVMADRLKELLPAIQAQLAPNEGSWKVERLAAE